MRQLLLLLLIPLICSCRILPPLPGMVDESDGQGDDTKLFRLLDEMDWANRSYPAGFDRAEVRRIFGGFLDPDCYEIMPRDSYTRSFSKETAGIRRIFKFYISATDYVSGLTVFVHEAVHGLNWIDIFDMDYNEFISIAGELRLVQLIAPENPDLAVSILGRAMGLFSPRDLVYQNEEHQRARLYLCALLEKEDPDKIYPWARDASKSDYYKKVNEALGYEKRDVFKAGMQAFASRHFSSSYIQTLLDLRLESDEKKILARFKELEAEVPRGHVFWDNVQYQIIRMEYILRQYKNALKRAERAWPVCQNSFLRLQVIQLAFLSACKVKGGDKKSLKLWRERAEACEVTQQQKYKTGFVREECLLEHNIVDLNHALDYFEDFMKNDYYKDNKYFIAFFSDEADLLLGMIYSKLSKAIEKKKNLKSFEKPLRRYSQLCQKWKVGFKNSQFLNQYYQSLLGDEAFRKDDLETAWKHYKKSAKQGEHKFETEFWLKRKGQY